MKKKGFTLVELIAAIAILSIIALIATPGILKSYNKSKQQAMTIQESKLVEAGDILLDDYCNKAISDDYKKKCDIIYQELDKNNSDRLSGNNNKTYKYICVKDIKKLEYYTEELKYGGDTCQGVVIYEIDNNSKMQTDSFSYVKCNDAYESDPERKVLLEELFSNCFTPEDTEQNYLENKKYNVTVKYVVNDVNGMQVANNKKYVVKASDFRNDIIFTFPVPTYRPQNDPNVYNAAINTGRHRVTYNRVNKNGEEEIQVTDMPESDMTIAVVYTVGKHSVASNYYFFNPNSNPNYGTSESDKIKASKSVEGFTMESVELDVPLEITSSGEKHKLYSIYLNNDRVASVSDNTLDSFEKIVAISTSDKIYDFVYQREAFNVTYNNNGGTGCTTGRVKYNQPYGTLCTPTKVGFDFKHWSLTPDGNSSISSTTNNNNYQDLTLYAVWTAHSYKIDYALNSGTMNPAGPNRVQYDSVINIVNPSKTGYTFSGWTVSSGLNTSTAKHGTSGTSVTNAIANASTKIKSTYFKNLTPTNDAIVTMTANYTANTYNIAFDCNGGTGSTATISGVQYGQTKTLTNNGCSRTGYDFGGWSYNGNTYGNQVGVKNLTATNGATVTLKAIWELKPFTISYNLGDVQMAALGSSAPTSAKYNQTVTISNPTAPGFTFMGWTVTGTGASISGTSLKMGTGNVTLTANWEANLADYVTFLGNNYAASNSMKKDNTSDQNVRYYHREPNNYVKFNNELWRIIGVFNVSDGSSTTKRVKLIRETSLIHASWDSSSSSINGGRGVDEWSQADTKTLLNDYYFNGSGSCKYCNGAGQSSCTKTCSFSPMTSTAKAMVGNAVWYLGGIEYGGDDGDATATGKEAYNLEREGRSSKPYCKSKNPNSGHCNDSVTRKSSWTGAVGLIYTSDFGFASGKPECYDVDVTYNSNCGRNWMYPSDEEEGYWTITHRRSNWFGDAVHRALTWTMGDCTTDGLNGLRPSVYLKRTVKVINGNGSKDKPYILK